MSVYKTPFDLLFSSQSASELFYVCAHINTHARTHTQLYSIFGCRQLTLCLTVFYIYNCDRQKERKKETNVGTITAHTYNQANNEWLKMSKLKS